MAKKSNNSTNRYSKGKPITKTNNPPAGYVGLENAQQVRTIRVGKVRTGK